MSLTIPPHNTHHHFMQMATLIHPIPPLPSHPQPTTLHHLLSSSTSLTQLKQIHAQILRTGFDRSNYSLLFKLLFSSCNSQPSNLNYSLSIFNQMHKLDLHSCNRFLRELSRSSKPEYSLFVYEKMRRDGLVIDRFSLPPLLKASARVSGLVEGMELHGLAAKLGFASDPFVQTGLVSMYAACGEIEEARLVFDKMSNRDMVSWNIMINGYCSFGLFNDVYSLVEEMKRLKMEPDKRTFSMILSACGREGNIEFGKAIHELISKSNCEVDSHLQCTLVTMYAGCGSMDMAQNLFDKLFPKNLVASTAMVSGYSNVGQVDVARSIFNHMAERDLVCWSAMISGYAENDQPQEALHLFNQMQCLGLKPDQVTLLSVISACAHLGALDHANRIQIYVDENGFGKTLPVNNALIDMYAKCGSLDTAKQVFARMHRRNVISWTSMISAYAVHGDANNAIMLFNQMKGERIEPNAVTFVGLLYACSHAGLIEEGRKMFASMVNDYNIMPTKEHYGCMIDLYGRANLLREALDVIENMSVEPNVVIWGSLMAACRIHGDVELGEYAAKRVLELEPDHDGAHVVLSNIYAKEKLWQNVGEMRKLMQRRGICKERGCSMIKLNGEIHEFLTADKNHVQSDEIYAKLDDMVSEFKCAGYAPNTSDVLVDLDEEEKKEVVLWHSEKLALSYGLITEKRGSCIRIIKNLRICKDCHTFMKVASRIYQREIVVRDRTRFHHYRDGTCSCKDYW